MIDQPIQEQPATSDLFQESEQSPVSLIEWGGQKQDVPPSKEQISISLLQEGHSVDGAMLDAHKEQTEQVNQGNEEGVLSSSLNTLRAKMKKRREALVITKASDLEDAHKDEVLVEGIWSPLEHKIAATEDTLTTKLLNQQASESPEELERITQLLAGADQEIRYRQAINNGYRMLAKMEEEIGVGETIADVTLSMAQPLVEAATFHNIITDVVPAANLTGLAIPSQDADDLVKYIVGLPREEGAAAINDFIEAVYQRQNQYGIGENKLTNMWAAQVLMNYLTEDRSTEEGTGFLGMQNVSDMGLNLMAGLDLLNAAQLSEYVGMMVSKTLRKPAPYKDFGNSSDAWKAKPLKNKKPETTMEDAADIIPEHVMSKDTGSLADIQESVTKGSTKKMTETVPPERLPEGFETLGSSTQSKTARLRPNSTGSLSNTLPPSALDPNLSRLWEATTNKSHTTMMGFKGDRTAAQAKFSQEFLSITVGVPRPSGQYWTPPAEGDSISNGTFHVRLGATPDAGFTDVAAAEQLLDTYRRKGVSGKIVFGDNEMFVELSSTQVMKGEDAGKFGSDGQKLVTPFTSSMILPPSERMSGITASMSPQRVLSYAIDAGQGIKQGLMEAAEPFLKVAKQLTAGDTNLVMKAVLQGEKDEIAYSLAQLKEAIPEISPAAIEGYFSYRSTMDGIAMIRSMQKRVTLDAAGMKQVLVGDVQFYGRVIAEKPTVRQLDRDAAGMLIPQTETDKVFTGASAWNPLGVMGKDVVAQGGIPAGRSEMSVPITQSVIDDLYETGGRLIRMSKPETLVDGNDYNFAIVRSMDDMAIEELPVYPDYGKVGFASERMYADAGALVVRTGVKKQIDGIETLGTQVVGIAKTIGEAKGVAKYYSKQHPTDNFKIQDSREVKNLINQGGSGTEQPSFMMKRGEHVTGSIVGGQPKRAEILDIGESLQRSMHSAASFPLQLAEAQIEGRWMNQYGQFLKPNLQGAFPVEYSKELFDVSSIEKAGLKVPDLRRDSELLHHLAQNIRSNRIGKMEGKARSQMAQWARAVGQPDNIVAALASKAITRASKVSPQQILRGTTGTLQIALAVTFQPVQNIINSLTLLGIQGEKGVKALNDAYNLIYAMRQMGNGADYEAALMRISNSLEVDRELANQFVSRYRTSGIAGSAGQVDNVLRHVTEAIHVGVGRGFGKQAIRAATAPVRGTIDAGKAIVSGSIDFTMYGFWSLSFRKTLEDYKKAKLAIGDDDFWEKVRQHTREMSQNQNGSDLLSFEEKGHALAFMLQFQQHIQKQAIQGTKLGGKALGVDKLVGKVLDKELTLNSPFARTHAEAVSAWGGYLLLGGTGGATGLIGIQMMHDLLPDEIANPKTKTNKAINAFVMGGLIDLSVNTLWDTLGNADADEQNVIVAGATLAGSGVDIVQRYVKVVEELIDTGKIDMDVVEGLGGAAAGTFSQTFNIFRLLPTTMNTEGFDTLDEMYDSFELLAQITKGGRDIFTGINMLEFEKRIGTQSGKLSGVATTKTAILKMFGFNSTAHVIAQGYNSSIFSQRQREDALIEATLQKLRTLRTNTIKPDVPESFEKYEVRQDAVMRAVGLALSESQQQRVRKKILTESLVGIHGDETFKYLQMMNKYNVDTTEMVREAMNMPDTDAETVKQLQMILAVINNKEEE